jgi:UDP-N-acetylmuramyl pentapeptide phosphotransferase/UDP-N-acetylglucosamine-1-phosphate transferase
MEVWAAAALTFAASVAGTRIALAWLRHKQILDLPNERSSHSLPTPRGGGLGVTPVVAASLLLVAPAMGGAGTVLATGALALMALSWLDDRFGLPAGPRFAGHALAIAAALVLMGAGPAFGGALPPWLDRVLAGLGWLWFVNLFNFMDGIDGISGVESTAVGLGIAVVGGPDLAAPALAVAAAGAGFLVWNWHPAKVFLGDSGSIPLGFVLGGLLLLLAAQGQLAAALILPAYYVADATITLLWRLRDGEKVWQAHRRHFYQRAVRGGHSHAQVSGTVAVANLLLIGCAWMAAQGWTVPAALAAAAVVAGLLGLFTRWAGEIAR